MELVQLGSLMIAEKVTIFVLCLFLLSSLSTSGNIQSLALLLGDVTAFHNFTTGRETAAEIELASILTIFLRLTHLENWLLIDQGFLMLDAGLDGVMVRWTDLSRYQSKMLPCR